MATENVPDVVDVSKRINDQHSFTIGWLLDSLRANDEVFKHLHAKKPVKEVTCKNISEGKGFLSHVFQCKITFDNDRDASSNYSTVIKIPFLNESDISKESEEDIPSLTEVHKWECVFYNNFAKLLEIPLPNVYKTVEWIIGKQEGCIHMEDLSIRGKCLSHFDDINLTQTKCFIRHLAHWHKIILSTENWRGKYLKNATMIGNFIKGDDETIDQFLINCKRKDVLLLVEKYRNFCLNDDFIHFVNVQAHKDLELSSVIVHGDISACNIMWSTDADGNVQNGIAGIIDWQVMHEGSPMSDLSCFLSRCLNGAVRRQAEEFAIQYYYDCLVKEFGDKNLVPYSVEKLQIAYDYFFILHGLHTLGISGWMFKALDRPNQSIKNAYYDYSILKSLHAWGDVDHLLQGKYKHIFEKYQKT